MGRDYDEPIYPKYRMDQKVLFKGQVMTIKETIYSMKRLWGVILKENGKYIPIEELEAIKQIKVPSHTLNKDYIVSIYPSGRTFCTCPAFMYRKQRPCKHIMSLGQKGLIETIPQNTPIIKWD